MIEQGSVRTLFGHIAEVPDRLVAQQLDALPDRVLELLGHPEGMLVGVLVKGVQEGGPVGGGHAVPVEEDGRGAQDGFVATLEDLGKVE